MKSQLEPFEILSTVSSDSLYPDFLHANSGKAYDLDVQLQDALRTKHPDMNLTVVPANNCPLLYFASLGHAAAELDTSHEPAVTWRGYVPPQNGYPGAMVEMTRFAKYKYSWLGNDFVIYTIGEGSGQMQYVLTTPGPDEDASSHCVVTDLLIKTVVELLAPDLEKVVYVYDGGWRASKELYNELQHAEWDDVILDPKTKEAVTDITHRFFDSEEVYRRLGVAWKRGIVLHGPPGNGKTMSLKRIMHSLYQREEPVPSLYVKAAPFTYDLARIFQLARSMSPCLLIMEDIETIVNETTRSYFFNEMDGLASNDGIMTIATTNYLDRLDPGLSKRPSRFDRKYLFPLPGHKERTAYADYWRKKLAKTDAGIEFPEKLCGAIADITDRFSFAFMQELFVASLLVIAHDDSDPDDGDDNEARVDTSELFEMNSYKQAPKTTGQKHPELDKYKLWRVIKKEAALLREDIGNSSYSVDLDHIYGKPARSGVGSALRPEPAQVTGTVPLFNWPAVDGQATAQAGNLPRPPTTMKRDSFPSRYVGPTRRQYRGKTELSEFRDLTSAAARQLRLFE